MGHHAADVHHSRARCQPSIVGLPITSYSHDIVERLASRANLHSVQVTSVYRAVQDQARIFFQKHIIEGKSANYKNKEVSQIVAHARQLHAKGTSNQFVQQYLMRAIEDVRGGPGSVSRHLLGSPFLEVFDIAHYSGPTKGTKRHNYMTDVQAKAFLNACRELMPFPISRLGHSAELGFQPGQQEFADEKCFHFEILQPFDGLEVYSLTKYA
jgi:hypothetical protein